VKAIPRFILASLVSLLALACGDDSEEDPPAASAETFEEQVALGATLYSQNCASCHGRSGEGGDAPRLVGLEEGALPLEPASGSGRTTEFETVADVASFVVANMPANAPGSLDTDEYYAILAFALDANGIELDEPLDAALAAQLTIPR
jgi:cytochrome c